MTRWHWEIRVSFPGAGACCDHPIVGCHLFPSLNRLGFHSFYISICLNLYVFDQLIMQLITYVHD